MTDRNLEKTGNPMRKSILSIVATLLAALAISVVPSAAGAVDFDPDECTANVTFDPSIPTPESVFGGPLAPNTGGNNTSNNAAKKSAQTLEHYLEVLADAAPEMVIMRSAGTTALGRDIPYVIVSSPANIADLEDDATFWRAVREGEVDPLQAKMAVSTRPAFAWITANVHGDEPSGGEATVRLMYELAARRDCANYKRLNDLTTFMLPMQNPDGRDQYQRTNAWAFDLNRDWHTQEQSENYLKMEAALEYPSVVYVDAHQQGGSSFFFPPNEDPVHHEISDASMNGINFIYGPALQKRFNDQNISYNNYSSYDLFTPEYGDTAPSLLLGASGMTYEKGRGGSYAKQVYDHYLSLDETLNVTSRKKIQILGDWVDQWSQAIDEGQDGLLEPNQIVSPGHTITWNVPEDEKVFGYYYLPNNHDGDVAKMISVLQRAGVKVYEVTADTPVTGMHRFGDMTVNDPLAAGPERQTPNQVAGTLPAGTLYIPMAQSMKHWLQAVLGEDPFVPYAYFYDVAGWSFSELKGMSGNGYLMAPLPSGTALTPISAPDYGTDPATAPVYAFATDSSRALIMATQLAESGATLYRAGQAFQAGGIQYPTGTALLDGSTLASAGVDLPALSDEYQTPVQGLDAFPAVSRYAIEKPKLAMYTTAAAPAVPPADRCNLGGTPCQAYFTLTEKMGLDVDLITTDQLTAGDLASEGYTALVNPNSTISGEAATALQQFVNEGGNYFGFGSNALTSARNAGTTLVNTTTNGPTGGIPVKVDFETGDPLAWGFDNGGFLFRASGAMTMDPTTLTGNGGSIPDAVSSITYPDPTLRFAYGTNIDRLFGKPAAVSQAFGAGTVTVLSVDPTFRSWLEGAERIMVNGMLYPNGEPIGSVSPAESHGPASAAAPLPSAKLPKVTERPVKVSHDPGRDLVITVKAKRARILKKAFRTSKAPRKIKRRAKFIRRKRRVSLYVRNARSLRNDTPLWVDRTLNRLQKRKVRVLFRQV